MSDSLSIIINIYKLLCRQTHYNCLYCYCNISARGHKNMKVSQLYCVAQNVGQSLNFTAWRRVSDSLSIILRGAECRTVSQLYSVAQCRTVSQLYSVAQSVGKSLNYTAWRRLSDILSIILILQMRRTLLPFGLTQPSIKWVPDLFPGVKRPRRGVNPQPHTAPSWQVLG